MNRKISLPRRIMVKSAGAFSDLFPENHMLQTTEYTISSEKIPREFEGYRILQLSDLHSRCFGHKNARLLRKIEEAEPDLIVMTGDMITRTDLDHHVFLHAARLLGKRYLCYYVLGNHEQALKPADFSVYLACVSSFGVRVLDNAKADLFRNGESIRLYGMWYPLKYYKESKHIAKHEVFQAGDMHRLMGRCDASRYTILLTHNPLSFPVYSGWGADLTLCGHVHGGMIRLPFLGGLLSPERGFFPKYSAGAYERKETEMIVSRGLGSGLFGARILNPPEIVLIKLHHSSGGLSVKTERNR